MNTLKSNSDCAFHSNSGLKRHYGSNIGTLSTKLYALYQTLKVIDELSINYSYLYKQKEVKINESKEVHPPSQA
jgi:hypothetical protein